MKRKVSIGQLISIIGTLIICVGLFCNGLEVISNTVFRIIVLVGIIAQAIALFSFSRERNFECTNSNLSN